MAETLRAENKPTERDGGGQGEAEVPTLVPTVISCWTLLWREDRLLEAAGRKNPNSEMTRLKRNWRRDMKRFTCLCCYLHDTGFIVYGSDRFCTCVCASSRPGGRLVNLNLSNSYRFLFTWWQWFPVELNEPIFINHNTWICSRPHWAHPVLVLSRVTGDNFGPVPSYVWSLRDVS